MAYELYYRANFYNEINQLVEISIYKKDADPPDAVEDLELPEDDERCVLSDNSEGQTKYECIIARELAIALRATDNNTLTWETFIDAEHDTWKIEMLIDSQYYFQGFITPDEGNGPFQDKPYGVNLRATNGLALLKDVALVDVNGDQFDGDHSLIEYISGALKQTGLDLNIRIYCGYFHASMLNKGNGMSNDMFQQAKLNYRTFQKDPTTFVSCYDALKIILDKFCTVEYWNGMWVIASIAEKQYIPNDRYYVDYDSDGAVIDSGIDTNNYGRVGKQMEIYPINESQSIYARFGVKSVNTKYFYNIFPQIPTNNKFEYGTEFETGDAEDVDDINGDGNTSEIIGTYKKYTINNWDFGAVDYADAPDFPLTATTGIAYRRSVFNDYGVEIDRAIVMETPSSGRNWLRSEHIPVTRGSKIRIRLEKKFTNDFTTGGPTFTNPAIVYLIPDGDPTVYYSLSNDSGGVIISVGRWDFEGTTFPSVLRIGYAQDQNSTKYNSLNLESLPIPVNGKLYIALEASSGGSPGDEQWYKNIELEYIPFTAGGYTQVKGDQWHRTQSANFPDVIDEEVFISDSPHRVSKGALVFNDQLTDGAWYRHGPVSDPNVLDEQRHFKELLNIGRFNHSYRRMYNLEGEFKGLNWAPENDSTTKYPIAFFWMYREVDMPTPRDFVLVPPLKMDIMRGWITANLVEVKKDSSDGTQGGTAEFKYIF